MTNPQPSSQASQALHTVVVSILNNFVMMLIKGISGYLGNSYALIADAIESMADIVSSILLYAGLQFAHKPPDDNHPYGHGKIEPLLTLIIGAFLLGSAGLITYHSIGNINTPHPPPQAWTLLVLLPIILGKEFAFQHIMRRAKQLNSTALKAEAWHQRSDALTSISAFIGISVAVVMGDGYESADDWAALVAAVLITYNSLQLLRPTFAELMDEDNHGELVAEIRKESEKVVGILGTEKCFVRKSGAYYWVDLHALVDGSISVHDGHQLAHELKDHLQATIPNIQDVLIHIEPFLETRQNIRHCP